MTRSRRASHDDWHAAMRACAFETAWAINDADIARANAASVPKHAGPRHLQRIWRGEPLNGRRVLVRCFHGLGDTLQFIRFATPLRARAAEVIVWCQPELMALVGRAGGVDRALPLHDGAPDCAFDVDIEVMELAHALRADAAMIDCAPYLRAVGPHRSDDDNLAVGLVWRAGGWDDRRSLPAAALAPLRAIAGVRLASLQLDATRDELAAIGVQDCATPEIDALAARLAGLDLVVTVDTMVAHLAGALGVQTWTLLHSDPDWRWPHGDGAAPWYRTMRLFPQRKPGDWDFVVSEVAAALCARASGTGNRPPRLPLHENTRLHPQAQDRR